MAAEPAVRCSGLVKIYESPSGRIHAVRGIDFEIARGSTTAIMGPSGSGKSSLLRMVSGLSVPSAGQVEIDGVDLFALGRHQRRKVRSQLLTHIEQRPSDNLLAHLTCAEQVHRMTKRRGVDPAEAEQILAAVGLETRLHHLPHQLSGGEQQRLAFARGTVGRAPLVIADEPTGELDTHSAEMLVDSFEPLRERGVSILIATHDPRVLRRVDEVIELRDGAVATVTKDRTALSVIDGSGRIQLPPALRRRFPQGRVVLSWNDDQNVLEVREP